MSDTAQSATVDPTLERVPLGDLRARYGLAQTSLRFSQVADGRRAAMQELDAIRAELKRRGYGVPK